MLTKINADHFTLDAISQESKCTMRAVREKYGFRPTVGRYLISAEMEMGVRISQLRMPQSTDGHKPADAGSFTRM